MSHFRPAARRAIAGTVLVTFASLVLQPLAVLAQDKPGARRPVAESGEERFSRLLNETHEILKELAPGAAMPQQSGKPGEKDLRAIGPGLLIEVERAKPLAGVDVGKKVKELRAKTEELLALESDVRKGFDATAKHIKDKNLPPEILARHDDAVRAYAARSAEFKALVNAVAAAGDSGPALDSALANLGAFMTKYPNQKTHTPTDPNNLPWGSPKPVKRAPYTTPEQFKTSGLFDQLHAEQLAKALKRKPLKVAQAGGLSGIGLPTATLPTTPEPADLAETEDVQLTPAIRTKAAELGNQPVAIYNWVRNNIEFVPSYGSIQGSDMTLQTKRGNAFDTASLLIALMRAANIPARYVYGTIEVPAEKVMNWVGGVTVPEAAQTLMGQGGIPNLGIAEAGRVQWIQLEHVWVEAYVDYVPSRGAVHRQGDTWVPLDASFKQYVMTRGMDIRTNVPFDASSLMTQIQQVTVVNESEGWIQNFNQGVVQQSLASYQAQITNYVRSQKQDATMADIAGTQTIVADTSSILHGTLPYPTVAVGARFQTMPDSLRWKFRFTLYASQLDRAFDSSVLALARSTPSLAGRKLTLSFSPATSADRDTVREFLPQPNPDGSIERDQLPQSFFPGHLIRLTPELSIDGQLHAAGPPMTMGSELIQSMHFYNPATGQWEGGEDNRPLVGEFSAIALDLQGIGEAQLAKLHARMELTGALLNQFRLNPADQTPLQSLTAQDVSGDMLLTGILGFFATVDGNQRHYAKISGDVVAYRLPSYGRFFASAQPRLLFGIPYRVAFPALTMDVDYLRVQAEAKNGNSATRASFVRQVGTIASAAEHAMPEQMLRDPNKPADDPTQPQGLSAVKALAIAAAQGQRIYRLDPQNQPIHASTIAGLGMTADTKTEIANALAAGKEVTVHQTKINAFGMTGAGYLIIDPQTGAGAYKIEGGADGAIFTTWLSFVVVGLLIAAAFAAGAVVAATIALVLLAANIIMLIASINQSSTFDQIMAAHAFAFFAALASIAGLALVLLGAPLGAALIPLIATGWILVMRWGVFPPGWLQWLVGQKP